MPVVLPAELPTADVVIVVPDEGRVLIFIDPRVPFAVGADTIARVRAILRGPFPAEGVTAIRRRVASLVQGPPYALG